MRRSTPRVAGGATIENIIGSPSGSLPVNVIALAVSSGVDTDCGFAVGASFTGVTVIDTTAVLPNSVPSQIRKLKLSGPL